MADYSTYLDEQLLLLLKNNDEGAFTELYIRYWDKLFTIAARKLGNPSEAEEIIQDIFLDLWNRRTTLQINSAVKSYLAVAVKYRVINLLAHKYQVLRFEKEINKNEADYSTTQWLSFEELQERLAALVAQLPEKCRIVFTLSRNEGLSQKQIASRLGIAEKTVESHLSKALRDLRTGIQSIFTFFI